MFIHLFLLGKGESVDVLAFSMTVTVTAAERTLVYTRANSHVEI